MPRNARSQSLPSVLSGSASLEISDARQQRFILLGHPSTEALACLARQRRFAFLAPDTLYRGYIRVAGL
jgi:hypothetical protein